MTVDKNNSEGFGTTRLEDGNAIAGIGRIHASSNDIVPTTTTVLFLSPLTSTTFVIIVNGNYIDDLDRGDMVFPGDFLRVYTSLIGSLDVDAKVITLATSPGYTYITCIVEIGNYLDIQAGDTVSWETRRQYSPIVDWPMDLITHDVTSTTAKIKWGNLPVGIPGAVRFQVEWQTVGYGWNFSPLLLGTQNYYEIFGLLPNERHIWAVMTYFSEDLKYYGKYSPFQSFYTIN